MNWVEVFLAIFCATFAINIVVLTAYVRFARMMDNRYFAKRSAASKGGTAKAENNSEQSQTNKKVAIKKVYVALNSYFYGWMRYCIIKVGHFPSHRIRNLIYRTIFCMKISQKTVIYGGCEIRSPWNISIGNSVISVGCILDGREKITIGDNVVFGTGVHVWTEEHNMNDPYFRVLPENSQPVVIEDRAWICSDSTILPGVHIGEGAVVAARACVTKNCEAFGVYGGIPAKKINIRNKNLEYQLNGKPVWHFY